MTTARRTTLNWTDRRTIDLKHVTVDRHEVDLGKPEEITVDINLPTGLFPDSAYVAIEAYRNPISKRFECETVGNLKVPNPLQLDSFSSDSLPALRLLVVDSEQNPGRLLGTIEKIKIPGSGNRKYNKKSMLVVDLAPLGNEIWKVSFESAGPRLVVNGDIPNILHDIEHKPKVYGFIVPAAFKQILTEIAFFHELHEADDSDDSWLRDWIEFCKKLGTDEDPRDNDDEDKVDWIERCVSKFCDKHNFLSALKADLKD